MKPDTNNEVARLRELLNRAIEIADEFWKNQKQAVTVWHGELADELEEIKAKARLAPAPEETQDGATMAEWYGGFAKIESTEPDPRPTKQPAKPSTNKPNKPVRLESTSKFTHEGNNPTQINQVNPETYDPNQKSSDCDCNHAPCEHKVMGCPVRHRIEELRSCPAYETHIKELESLALKVLEDGEEQISMLTEVLEDTEQVRNSWCEAYTEARDENQKLREIVERYRVWATSENPTQMELDDLKQKYDELN